MIKSFFKEFERIIHFQEIESFWLQNQDWFCIGFTFLALLYFFRATKYNKPIIIVSIGWTILQIFLSYIGFYKTTEKGFPMHLFAILPPVAWVIWFVYFRNKFYIQSLDIKKVTMLSIIRFPFELMLLNLFWAFKIPVLRTFEGSSIEMSFVFTAPLIIIWSHRRQRRINFPRIYFWWHILGLISVANVLMMDIFTVPSFIQIMAKDSPNHILAEFPYVLIPTVISQIVLFSHLVCFKKLHYHIIHKQPYIDPIWK